MKLPLILLLVISMGTSGLEAFSEITGCKVTAGSYDLQDKGVIVRAEGEAHGVTWDILAAWVNGAPQVIVSQMEKVRI